MFCVRSINSTTVQWVPYYQRRQLTKLVNILVIDLAISYIIYNAYNYSYIIIIIIIVIYIYIYIYIISFIYITPREQIRYDTSQHIAKNIP